MPLYLQGSTRQEYIEQIAECPTGGAEGEELYSDLGYMLLGFAIEEVTGENLDWLFGARIAAVLDLTDIGFALVAPARTVMEIRVADTGIGIPDEERQRVFDPFYQVDSSSTREYGGTGLGLAIVQRLVQAHDGKVSVEPNHPQGTVFVVKLPTET